MVLQDAVGERGWPEEADYQRKWRFPLRQMAGDYRGTPDFGDEFSVREQAAEGGGYAFDQDTQKPSEFPDQQLSREEYYLAMFEQEPPTNGGLEAQFEDEFSDDEDANDQEDEFSPGQIEEDDSDFDQDEDERFAFEADDNKGDDGFDVGLYKKLASDQHEFEDDVDTNEQEFVTEDFVKFFSSPVPALQENDWSDRDFLKVLAIILCFK